MTASLLIHRRWLQDLQVGSGEVSSVGLNVRSSTARNVDSCRMMIEGQRRTSMLLIHNNNMELWYIDTEQYLAKRLDACCDEEALKDQYVSGSCMAA